MRIDRRFALKAGIFAGLSVTATSATAALRKTDEPPTVFVFDARFAMSRELAQSRFSEGSRLCDPRQRDLGETWRLELPAVLLAGGAVEGLTLWSDQMICTQFGLSHKAKVNVRKIETADIRAPHLWHWRLS